jgi:hypothetical protein
MKRKATISGILTGLLLLLSGTAYSQNTVLDIFKTARNYVRTIDSLGIVIDYIDFNIVTTSQNFRETWQSLSPEYGYILVAYGNENINKLKVELYDYKGGTWSFLERGTPLSAAEPYISMIDNFVPSAEASGKIKVSVEEFSNDETNGRYFLVVGKKAIAVTLTAYSRVPVKLNTASLKTTPTGKTENIDCTFKIYTNYVYQYFGGNLSTTFTISENLTTDENIKNGMYIYTLKDDYGKVYSLIIDVVSKSVNLFENTKKENIFTGWVYYFNM